jgi:hypothetical protein
MPPTLRSIHSPHFFQGISAKSILGSHPGHRDIKASPSRSQTEKKHGTEAVHCSRNNKIPQHKPTPFVPKLKEQN